MRRVFIRFLEEIEDSEKAFENYLTLSHIVNMVNIDVIHITEILVISGIPINPWKLQRCFSQEKQRNK